MTELKRYHEFIDEEMAALTTEEINNLIELEIAYDGILPVQCPESPKLQDIGIVKDQEFFECNGEFFIHEADAIAFSKMAVFKESYNYNIGYDYKWLERINDMPVKKVSYYSEDCITQRQKLIQERTQAKNEYSKKKEAYDKFTKATSSIRKDVWEKYYKALEKEQQVKYAKEQYAKYLSLAKNDEEIAIGFFKNAYKDIQWIIDRVLGKEVTE
jgi:hypothetical protein